VNVTVPADAETVDSFPNSTALVTGGSRGIGLAVARGLARGGATVVVTGAHPDRADRAAQELVAEGLDVLGAPGVDVSDPDALPLLAERLGPLAALDVLVISAAVMSERTAKTLRTGSAEWRRVMSVDLDGTFSALATFVPGMVERRHGRVIALSACLGRMSGPGTSGGLAPYRVAKAGVNALVKNLSAELGDGRRGVSIDAVCPGHCRTEMGGPSAPRSAEEGADTVLWLAGTSDRESGRLWEDRRTVPW